MSLQNLGIGLGLVGIITSLALPVSAEQTKENSTNFRSTQVDSPCEKLKGDEFIALSSSQTLYFSWSVACEKGVIKSMEVVPRNEKNSQKIYTTLVASDGKFYSNTVGTVKYNFSPTKTLQTKSIVFSTYI